MWKTCSACTSWEPCKHKESILYTNFLASHECLINHKGSAGSMETAGKRKLGYTHYIDDGKSHADVVKDEPYPDIVVES